MKLLPEDQRLHAWTIRGFLLGAVLPPLVAWADRIHPGQPPSAPSDALQGSSVLNTVHFALIAPGIIPSSLIAAVLIIPLMFLPHVLPQSVQAAFLYAVNGVVLGAAAQWIARHGVGARALLGKALLLWAGGALALLLIALTYGQYIR